MAVSLNSVASFNPMLQGINYSRKEDIKAFPVNIPAINSTRKEDIRSFPAKITVRKNVFTQQTAEIKPSKFHLSVAKGGKTTDTTNPNEETTDKESSEKPLISANSKKAPLTARERLRAARVLSRYAEQKPSSLSKPELNSKLMDALKESDKGKRRPGLPEAPTNMFDDSKRGMPKEGWTIDLPGGMDVYFIVFSFVFISTVMFVTTYLVWKVGAIHFNDY